MIKNLHLLTVAALGAASLFHTAHKDESGSASKAKKDDEKKADENKGPSLAEDPSHPHAVQGGQKLEAEKRESDPKRAKRKLPEPQKSPGTLAIDRSSLRETEVFKASDIVFVREGPNGQLICYPKHEADARFAEISDTKKEWKGDRDVITHKLKGGDQVIIDGAKVTVIEKEGTTDTDGPDLNTHPVAIA